MLQKFVTIVFNANFNSYLEIFGGQSLNQYLNAVHFLNTSVNLDICGSLRLLFFGIGIYYVLFYSLNPTKW